MPHSTRAVARKQNSDVRGSGLYVHTALERGPGPALRPAALLPMAAREGVSQGQGRNLPPKLSPWMGTHIRRSRGILKTCHPNPYVAETDHSGTV